MSANRMPEASALSKDGFGRVMTVPPEMSGKEFVALAEADADALAKATTDGRGLLLVRGLCGLVEEPETLVRLSKLFGQEVEDYRQTLMAQHHISKSVPEIFIVSNTPPSKRQPPKKPEPPLTADGNLPVQFPHRSGWHTDQSYRRPPPDFALFYAVKPAPKGQAQTLYADGTAAYDALPDDLKAVADDLVGIHAKPGIGRSPQAIRSGEPPQSLEPHEYPQQQPVVRRHPVTGKKALYLCEYGQMDWIEGPFVGMEPGPDGEGAALLHRLMGHYTDPRFVYVHEWEQGDLIIYDNRCTIHSATWFDADKHDRIMWRTTVRGNPGPEYAGEAPSWIPR